MDAYRANQVRAFPEFGRSKHCRNRVEASAKRVARWAENNAFFAKKGNKAIWLSLFMLWHCFLSEKRRCICKRHFLMIEQAEITYKISGKGRVGALNSMEAFNLVHFEGMLSRGCRAEPLAERREFGGQIVRSREVAAIVWAREHCAHKVSHFYSSFTFK